MLWLVIESHFILADNTPGRRALFGFFWGGTLSIVSNFLGSTLYFWAESHPWKLIAYYARKGDTERVSGRRSLQIPFYHHLVPVMI